MVAQCNERAYSHEDTFVSLLWDVGCAGSVPLCVNLMYLCCFS